MPKEKIKATANPTKSVANSPKNITSGTQLSLINGILAENWRLEKKYFAPLILLVGIFYVFCRYYFAWLANWLVDPLSVSGDFPSSAATLVLILLVVVFLGSIVALIKFFGSLIKAMAEHKNYWSAMTDLSWPRTFNLITYGLYIFFIALIPQLIAVVIGALRDKNLDELGNFLIYGTSGLPASDFWQGLFWIICWICAFILLDIVIRSFLTPVLIIKEGSNINTATAKARLMSRGNRIILFVVFLSIYLTFSLFVLGSFLLTESYSFFNVATGIAILLFCVIAGYMDVAIYTKIKKPIAVNPKQDSSPIKIILWVFIMPIIGCWVAYAFLHSAVSDIEAIDDKDLTVAFDSVPFANNAYFDLFKSYPRLGKQIFNAVANQNLFLNEHNYVIDSYATGKTWDQAEVDKILARGSYHLMRYDEVKSKSAYQVPIGQFSEPGFEPSFNLTMMMMRLAAMRGENALRHGNANLAKDEALDIIRFSRVLSESKSISYYGYAKAKTIALELGWPLLNRAITSGRLNYWELSALSGVLRVSPDTFDNAARGQYLLSKSMVSDAVNYYRDERYFLQPKQCSNELALITKNIMSLSKLSAIHFYVFSPDAVENYYGMNNSFAAIFRRNRFCDSFLAAMISNAAWANEQRLSESRAEKATIVRVAALRYKSDRGELPYVLTDLVPTYLGAIPADPYDLRAFKYNHTAGTVYAIGKNLIDNKGRGDDFALRLETAPTSTISQ